MIRSMPGNRSIILSIKPRFAEAILDGSKTIELRRSMPKHLNEGGLVLLYSTFPVKAIVGAFEAKRIWREPIHELWCSAKTTSLLTKSEFLEYFCGVEEGVAISVARTWRITQPLALDAARSEFGNFTVPRSFRYATQGEAGYGQKIQS